MADESGQRAKHDAVMDAVESRLAYSTKERRNLSLSKKGDEEFEALCNAQQRTPSAVLNEFMLAYLAANEKPTDR